MSRPGSQALERRASHRPVAGLSLEEKRVLAKRLMRERSRKRARAEEPFGLLGTEDRHLLGDDLEDAYPISRLQAGMLFQSELRAGEAVYHDLHSAHLRGPFDRAALETTVRDVVERHPALRASFELSALSEPVQRIHRHVEPPLRIEDLRTLPEPEQERHLSRWLERERCRPFDYSRPPVFTFTLHRRADDRFQFTLSFHHAILDGWSAASLLAELFRRYLAAAAGTPLPVDPPPATTFGHFVALELRALASAATRSFWSGQLAGSHRLELPRWPRTGPPAVEGRGAQVLEVALEPGISDRLRAEARVLSVPVKSLLLAAHVRALGVLTGQRDIVTGVVINGRPERADGERVLGVFLNTLPVRLHLGPGTWRDLAAQAFEAESALWPHRHFPGAELQRLRGEPLFEVLFNFMHFHVYRGIASLGGMEVLDRHSYEETDLPLLVNFFQDPRTSRVGLALNWPAGVFAREEVRRMAAVYRRALTALARDPGTDHRSASLLSAAEEHQARVEWNDTGTDYGSPETLHRSIERQARRSPDAAAVLSGSYVLSYAGLDAASNRLARHLGRLGVGRGVPVGVCLHRSVDLSTALLAILKAGGAYLPLDPSYPPDRLRFMLDDCGAPVVVSRQGELREASGGSAGDGSPWDGKRLVLLDRHAASIAGESSAPVPPLARIDDLAYVIYTSGSTGRPKGVMNSHRGIWNRLAWMQAAYRLDASDRVLQKTTVSFDVSVWELFWPLMVGAGLVMARPGGHQDPRYLARAVVRQRITTLHFVPSMLRAFLDEDDLPECPDLRRVITSGEALSPDLRRRFLARFPGELHNLYGPTEAAVDVTAWACRRDDDDGTVPIGRPIGNLRVHVLDGDARPAAYGALGELHLGGVGLARGYLRRPATTAERFVPDATGLTVGGRLYRTGDLTRQRPDGVVDFLGRVDDQVKVRGVRVELGEIETVLLGHDRVAEAAVVATERTGATQLVAYVVLHPADDDASAEPPAAVLRELLGRSLTPAMVPAHFVFLDALPLTPNGKLDRRALPAWEMDRGELTAAYVAPRNGREEVLAEVWSEILGVERIGVHDNFFDLGGDSILSLRARARGARRGIVFSLEQLFAHPTVADLLAAAGGADAPDRAAEPRSEPWSLVRPDDRAQMPPGIADAYPLARLQGGMLFHGAYREGVATYHDVVTHHLRAPFDGGALAAAAGAAMARHPVLRTAFDLQRFSEPLQLVHARLPPPVAIVDLARLPPAEQDAAVGRWLHREAFRPYDLGRPPLFRITLHLRDRDRFQFSFSFHHAILDGWSVASLLTELFRDYLARLGGSAPPAEAPPATSFRDFVALERAAIESPETRDFWRRNVRDGAAAALPRWRTPAGRGADGRRRGRTLGLDLPEAVTTGVGRLARKLGVPPKSVLLAAHLKVLGVLGNVEEPRTGLVVNGRSEADDGERVLGLFLNTVPVGVSLRAPTWSDLVRETFAAEAALLGHRRYPLAEIAKHAPEPALFETVFNFVHFHVYQGLAGLPGVELIEGDHFEETNYTLTVHFRRASHDGRLQIELAYDAAELSRAEVAALGGYLRRTLEAMTRDPEGDHRAVSSLTPAQRHQVLVEWNDTAAAAPEGVLLHRWIAGQAERTPEATALVLDGRHLSYRELDRRADRLARRLLDLGVAVEDRVGIALERSLELMVALLATLKAGAAYVPLDPSLPERRLAAILEDAAPRLILARSADLGDGFPGTDVPTVTLNADAPGVGPDSPPAVTMAPEHLAYVLFTSGSTGRPKGAMNTHRAIVNRLAWMQAAYGLDGSDRVLQKTPIGFDVSVWELFWPLLTGAALVLARPGGHRDSGYLVDAVRRHGVTTLHFVPSMLRAFVAAAAEAPCPGLRRVIASGEALPFELQHRFHAHLPESSLHNLYGPTEAAIDVTSWACRRDDPAGVVPIGRPIDNLAVHLLGHDLEPVPLATPGELHIGGVGLARGYLARPDLTAAAFVPHPHSAIPGARLYRTGDSVRHLPDGSLLYLDRLDQQVKIRGFRIELGEIEGALEGHPRVAEAVVVARDGTGESRQLVAYLIAAGEPPPVPELRAWLLDVVPDYMVPAAFVFLDTLPLTPNGKLDRRALPAPEAHDLRRDQRYVAPASSRERALAAIWSDVLGLDDVGVQDNFFELGGDSILSLQVVSRAAHAGIRLTPEQLFEHPTVGELAAADLGSVTTAEQGAVVGPVELTPIQAWLLEDPPRDLHHWNQALLLELREPVPPPLLRRALGGLLEHHDALRMRLEEEDGTGWRQWCSAPGGEPPLVVADLSRLPSERRPRALEEMADALQRSLDLTAGPVLRAGLFPWGDGEPERLLLCVHHLVIDGVSWRLVLEDLWRLIRSEDRAAARSLPPKTTSFQAWGEVLAARAASAEVQEEAAFWLDQAAAEVPPLPTDRPLPPDGLPVASTDVVHRSLAAAASQALLGEVHDAYKTRIDDLLLTALLRTFAGWSGRSVLRLDLEGHGRDAVAEVDLSRTVGWFTALHPLVLRLEGEDRGGALRGVKEQLRRVPGRGLGHGLLRYLGPDGDVRRRLGAAPRPEVCFTYLGQLDRALPADAPFGPAAESPGDVRSPRGACRWPFEVIASITDGRLQMRWVYSRLSHRRESVEALADALVTELEGLIDHCLSPDAGGVTASDFPLAAMDQDELDGFLAAIEADDP